MQWNLRLRAAERGIWKSAALRRMLADSGLEISAGKMSSWWAGNPPTLRLEELDVLCTVLDCTPNDLMTPNLTRSSLADPAHLKPPTATAMTRAATAMAVGPPARQWHPDSGSLGRARPYRNPHQQGRWSDHPRARIERSPAAAAQVQSLPAQPSRLDQSAR
jgi:DNA-binding Xre family transcriptional regulator